MKTVSDQPVFEFDVLLLIIRANYSLTTKLSPWWLPQERVECTSVEVQIIDKKRFASL
jgi:hypothetical protein